MKRTIETKFYTFNQNNSGGHFMINKKDGIAEYVVIEALNPDDAVRRMEDISIGYRNYCECCGPRWSDWMSKEDGMEEPLIYNKSIKKALETHRGKNAAIHYFDGKVEWVEI